MFDATPGGAQANSYVSEEAADAFFAGRLTPGATQWTAYEAEDRQKALMQATSDLNRVRFKGRRITTEQRLEFPRSGQREAFPEVPQDIQDATCLQAIFLLQNQPTGGRSRAAQLRAQGVAAYRVGDHSQEFSAGGVRTTEQHLGPEALGILKDWIANTGRIVSRRRVARRCCRR